MSHEMERFLFNNHYPTSTLYKFLKYIQKIIGDRTDLERMENIIYNIFI